MTINRESNVEFKKWDDFKSAVSAMIENNVYKSLVDIHGVIDSNGRGRMKHRMHGSMSGDVGYLRFLPWHRAFLIAFERKLREINSELSIPYWDWDQDAGRLKGVEDFTGLSRGRKLGRLPNGSGGESNRSEWFSSSAQTEGFENSSENYYAFSKALEDGPHNQGHNWVGGDMREVISPNDPIFWMHHAQIDRIWSKWQENHPGENAPLDALGATERKLDPWDDEFDVDSINNILDIGSDSYQYV